MTPGLKGHHDTEESGNAGKTVGHGSGSSSVGFGRSIGTGGGAGLAGGGGIIAIAGLSRGSTLRRRRIGRNGLGAVGYMSKTPY